MHYFRLLKKGKPKEKCLTSYFFFAKRKSKPKEKVTLRDVLFWFAKRKSKPKEKCLTFLLAG